MRKFRILPLIVLSLAAMMVARAMTPAARRSFEAFEQRVNSGDAEAQFRMSRILETGWDSIEPDLQRSVLLLKQSAEDGYAPAMSYLGYRYGTGVVADKDTLLKADKDSMHYWIGRAADAGDAKALSNLGFLILNEKEGNENDRDSLERTAFMLLNKAAEMGVPAAMSMTGEMYAEGRGTEKDTLKAATRYEMAIDAGLRDAEPRLIALMAARWMSLEPDSAYNLASEYLPVAPFAAVTLLERATKLPEANAKNVDEIGKMKLRGQLARAARSMKLLGDAAGRGRGLPYSHRDALKWYAKAALAYDPEAIETIAETIEFFPDEIAEIIDELGNFQAEVEPLARILELPSITLNDLSDASRLHELAGALRQP